MFDIGFFELTLIGIVTLLVVGPERLPKVAKTAGMWIGKTRGFITNIKTEIDKELKTEELQKILSQQTQIPGLEELIENNVKSNESLDNLGTSNNSKAQDNPTKSSNHS